MLICDLAETYGVLDYRQLPLRTVAALFFGLRETSRVCQKLAGVKGDGKDVTMAFIADTLAAIYSALTGAKCHTTLTQEILGEVYEDQSQTTKSRDYVTYSDAEAFEKAFYGEEEEECQN